MWFRHLWLPPPLPKQEALDAVHELQQHHGVAQPSTVSYRYGLVYFAQALSSMSQANVVYGLVRPTA